MNILLMDISTGFSGGISGKESACQCRRHKRCRFVPWVRKIPWRRAWPPAPVFLLGDSHEQRSLAGYSLQGRKELDTTEVTQHTHNLLSTGSLKLRVAVCISEEILGPWNPSQLNFLCPGKEQMCPGNTSWSYYQLSTVYSFSLWSLLSILEFSNGLLTYIKVCVIQFF